MAALVLLALGWARGAPRRRCQARPRQPRGRPRTPRRTPCGTRPARRAGQALDTATARRLGLPTAPSRSFAPPDSVVHDLLKARPGYQATRYRADSATVFIGERARAAARARRSPSARGRCSRRTRSRTGETAACSTRTADPHLFDRGPGARSGEGIRYDTCRRRGVVEDALTNFTEGSTVWFLRGNVAQDSSSSRIYAGSSRDHELRSAHAALPLRAPAR